MRDPTTTMKPSLLASRRRPARIFENKRGEQQVVKRGWSWPAFVFGVFWFAYKRIWITTLMLVALGAIVAVTLVALGTVVTTTNLLLEFLVFAHLLCGMFGNKALERHLLENNYRVVNRTSTRQQNHRGLPIDLAEDAPFVAPPTSNEPAESPHPALITNDDDGAPPIEIPTPATMMTPMSLSELEVMFNVGSAQVAFSPVAETENMDSPVVLGGGRDREFHSRAEYGASVHHDDDDLPDVASQRVEAAQSTTNLREEAEDAESMQEAEPTETASMLRIPDVTEDDTDDKFVTIAWLELTSNRMKRHTWQKAFEQTNNDVDAQTRYVDLRVEELMQSQSHMAGDIEKPEVEVRQSGESDAVESIDPTDVVDNVSESASVGSSVNSSQRPHMVMLPPSTSDVSATYLRAEGQSLAFESQPDDIDLGSNTSEAVATIVESSETAVVDVNEDVSLEAPVELELSFPSNESINATLNTESTTQNDTYTNGAYVNGDPESADAKVGTSRRQTALNFIVNHLQTLNAAGEDISNDELRRLLRSTDCELVDINGAYKIKDWDGNIIPCANVENIGKTISYLLWTHYDDDGTRNEECSSV